MLYSFKGQYPEKLPERFRTDAGLTLTSLETFSNEELFALGFTGPHYIPSHYPDRGEYIEWNGSEFIVLKETIETIETIGTAVDIDRTRIIENLNDEFVNDFNSTNFYLKIRELSLTNQKINALFHNLTESLSIKDRLKFEIITKKIILSYSFTILELQEYYDIIEKYSMTDAFDLKFKEEILSGNTNFEYDFITNKIYHTIDGPYKSWIKNEDGFLQPPIDYPTDGKVYVWDEKSISWKLYQ